MKKEKNRKGTVNGNFNKIFLLSMLLCFGTNLNLEAQCKAKNDAFKSGEQIVYDLFFNWKFVWIKAGLADMSTYAVPYQGKPALYTTLQAVGSKRADFFFRMRDTLTSIISETMEPLYFRKGAEEGKRYYVDEAWFHYKDGVSYVNQRKYKSWTNEVIKTEQSDSRCIYDMLSILAQARSFNPENYKVGDRIVFPMVTGTRVEDQTLIYRGKKEFRAENDVTYRCLVFSLVEYKKNKEKEVITFYITDDLNHIPVRLDMNLNFGTAKAFLKSVKGNRHPLTSIVKK